MHMLSQARYLFVQVEARSAHMLSGMQLENIAHQATQSDLRSVQDLK